MRRSTILSRVEINEQEQINPIDLEQAPIVVGVVVVVVVVVVVAGSSVVVVVVAVVLVGGSGSRGSGSGSGGEEKVKQNDQVNVSTLHTTTAQVEEVDHLSALCNLIIIS